MQFSMDLQDVLQRKCDPGFPLQLDVIPSIVELTWQQYPMMPTARGQKQEEDIWHVISFTLKILRN